MQGPWKEKKWCERSGGFSRYLVFVSPITKARPFDLHPSQKTDGGIQRQDLDLQHKLSTDRFRPDAVVLCPGYLQWIFVYSQISGRPLTPCQAVIRAQFPSHLSLWSHYCAPRPLLSPRAELNPKKAWNFFSLILVPSPLSHPPCS